MTTYQRAASHEAHACHELPVLPQHNGVTKTRTQSETLSLLDDHPTLPDQAVDGVRSIVVIDEKPRRRFSGWKVGALAGAGAATATLIVNIIALAWLQRHPGEDTHLVEIYRGDCGKVEQMQTWMHFAINALGTLLLSGSNYCMQVLCAPTRKEVDRAHKRGEYLDIGVQSIRNLTRISPWKTLLWLLLGFSSVPLHLMYNSAFYSSVATSSYEYFFMSPNFENFTTSSNDESQRHLAVMLDDSITAVMLERLDPRACVSAYASPFTTDRSNLILVTSNRTSDNSPLLYYGYYGFDGSIARGGADNYLPFGWICYPSERQQAYFGEGGDDPPPCDFWVSKIKNDIEHWTPYDYDIDFCLSERIDERCSFNGNIQVLIVVVCCNAAKIVCMLIVAFALRNMPLITIGDAITSFLKEADSTTKGYCLLSRTDIVGKSRLAKPVEVRGGLRELAYSYPNEGRPAERRTETWSKAASRTRWIVTIGCILFAVLVVCVLFGIGFTLVTGFSTSISALGFGKIHPAALITGWALDYMNDPQRQIIYAILVANAPQVILSFLYLNLNSLVTCMWLASEWNDFATERKHLRVSIPRGEQRSTYFLELPYRVGIPLMIVSGFLHWLVSQSIFLAVVSSYDWNGELVNTLAVATCGFSLVPMILVMTVGVSICIGTIWLGRRRLASVGGFMPLVGSCSLAIAAACHRPEWDEGSELEALQWGTVPEEHRRDENEAGHCSFTSGEVEELQVGRLYK